MPVPEEVTAPPAGPRLLGLEIAAVMTAAVGPTMTGAIVRWLHPASVIVMSADRLTVGMVIFVAALLLVAFTAGVRGESAADLGLVPRWRPLGWSIPLWLVAWLASTLAYVAAKIGGELLGTEPSLPTFEVPHSAALLAYYVIAPVFEETVVRAYFMTRLRQAGWAPVACVLASAGLQTAYHLYQGTAGALTLAPVFLLFAAFFAWKRNAVPVIAAHAMLDAFALWRQW